ncbi:MAG: hypothetical protein OXC62_04710 [Aestuariivita sp.]|nr:hypothetical protein [Aestuariivita sp.]
MLNTTFPQNDFFTSWDEFSYHVNQRYVRKFSPNQILQNKNSTRAIPHYRFQNLENTERETNIVHEQILKIKRVWESAQGFLSEINKEQAEQAFQEALALTLSRLFSKEINPEICIDHYGEFTFSHESHAGYVDIGVRGQREISYHIRNDIHPEKTKFDDCEWDLISLPKPLSIAMENLQREIRC